MSYRDPLFDKDAPQEPDVVDEMLATNADEPETGDKARQKADDMKHKGQHMAEEGKQRGQEVAGQARERADQMASEAQHRADEGIGRASEGLGTAADKLREQGDQQGGKTAEYASVAADKLDEASGYLRDKGSDDLLNDLEDLIRRKPMESLLAAAGIGLLLSRIVK